MDMRKVKKLIELLQSTGVAEIEIREGEESVRITREFKNNAPVVMTSPMMSSPPSCPHTHCGSGSTQSRNNQTY